MPDFENNLSKSLAYVSSALNACQAFDILLYVFAGESGEKKKTPGRKESHSKDMVIPSVPEASQVVSGLTFRFIYFGIDLEKDLCSLFHLSLSVVCRLIVLQECSIGFYCFLSFWGVNIDPVMATPHHLTNRYCKTALAFNLDHTFRIFESNQLGTAIRAVPGEWIPGIFAFIHF